MEFKISITRAKVTMCKLTGKYNRIVLTDAFLESQKRMQSLNKYRLILDAKEVTQTFDADHIENETERIRIANKMISAFAQFENVKIATVLNFEDVNHFIQFLVKRKGIELELFDNLKEAVRWIG